VVRGQFYIGGDIYVLGARKAFLAALRDDTFTWWLSSESWVTWSHPSHRAWRLALGAKLFRRHFPLSIGAVGAVLIGRFAR